jgi:hypothetical protein
MKHWRTANYVFLLKLLSDLNAMVGRYRGEKHEGLLE